MIGVSYSTRHPFSGILLTARARYEILSSLFFLNIFSLWESTIERRNFCALVKFLIPIVFGSFPSSLLIWKSSQICTIVVVETSFFSVSVQKLAFTHAHTIIARRS